MKLAKYAPVLFGLDEGLLYSDKVLTIQPANLIGYWPMGEAAGATANDLSSQNNDGAYTGVTLGESGIGDGNTCPWFDGANDYNNIYSVGFRDDFNGAEGTLAFWAKVNDASVWTDGIARKPVNLNVNSANYLYIARTVSNNQLKWAYYAGGVAKSLSSTAYAVTTWLHLALTWSAAADEAKAYANGAQVGATLTGLGVWVGLLAATTTIIGASTTTPTSPWYGWIAHGAVWTTPLSLAEIQQLATV